MRNARVSDHSKRTPCKIEMRHPGIEPGPPRWQRGIITTRLMTLGLMHSKERGQGGLEPPTSRTRSENHTSRPLAHLYILLNTHVIFCIENKKDSSKNDTQTGNRTRDLLRVDRKSVV
mgnify:CR=1 FL=1